MSANEKAETIADDIRRCLAGHSERTGWTSCIVGVIEKAKPDATCLAGIMARLHAGSGDAPGSLWAIREVIQPYLQARVALDQLEASKRFGRAATWLGIAAVLFSAVQALFAVLAYYKMAR